MSVSFLQIGRDLHRRGLLPQAEQAYEQVLCRDPDSADALHLMGILRCQQQRIAEGIAMMRRATASVPGNAAIWSDLGEASMQAGDAVAAESCFRQCCELQSEDWRNFARLADALASLGRAADAVAALTEAIARKPGDAALLNKRGAMRLAAGDAPSALDDLCFCLNLDPAHASALINLGVANLQLGRFAKSVEYLHQAVAKRPASAEAHYNLGNALVQCDRIDDALQSFSRAAELSPAHAAARNNQGMALTDLGRYDEALAAYRQALNADPQFADAQCNIGQIFLLRGQFEAGWRLYENRWRSPSLRDRHTTLPRWSCAEPLQDRRLLVWAEQGLGDAIQFARFVPLLAARCAQLVLEAPAELKELLRSVGGADSVHAVGEPLPECDLQIPLMSLGFALAVDSSTIPAQVPYLRAKYESGPGVPRTGNGRPRVGIVCSGSAAHKNDRNRSIPLREFAPLGELAQCLLIQPEVRTGDLDTLREGWIRDCRALIGDLQDTAELLNTLDLLISVDTSVAHLAGAMARPVWILLPYSPDWRWMLDRSDSPWYPTARLYRQPRPGDWASVIAQVTDALRLRFTEEHFGATGARSQP